MILLETRLSPTKQIVYMTFALRGAVSAEAGDRAYSPIPSCRGQSACISMRLAEEQWIFDIARGMELVGALGVSVGALFVQLVDTDSHDAVCGNSSGS